MTSMCLLRSIAAVLVLSLFASPVSCEDSSFWTAAAGGLSYHAQANSQVLFSDGVLDVSSGQVLIETDQDAAIKTPLSTVHVKKKSLILVRVSPASDRIFTLIGQATLVVGKHGAGLGSGEEAIVSGHDPDLKDIHGQDDIGRRRVRLSQLPDGRTLALTEFSLLHVVEREPLVYELVHSSEKRSKGVTGKLMKTAAVVNMVTSRHGPYTTGRP